MFSWARCAVVRLLGGLLRTEFKRELFMRIVSLLVVVMFFLGGELPAQKKRMGMGKPPGIPPHSGSGGAGNGPVYPPRERVDRAPRQVLVTAFSANEKFGTGEGSRSKSSERGQFEGFFYQKVSEANRMAQYGHHPKWDGGQPAFSFLLDAAPRSPAPPPQKVAPPIARAPEARLPAPLPKAVPLPTVNASSQLPPTPKAEPVKVRVVDPPKNEIVSAVPESNFIATFGWIFVVLVQCGMLFAWLRKR